MVPLFPGVPGGPELLVVLLLLVALFGVPVVVAVLGWRYLKGDRVEDLEARVEELESELEAADAGPAGGRDASTDDATVDDASTDDATVDDATADDDRPE